MLSQEWLHGTRDNLEHVLEAACTAVVWIINTVWSIKQCQLSCAASWLHPLEIIVYTVIEGSDDIKFGPVSGSDLSGPLVADIDSIFFAGLLGSAVWRLTNMITAGTGAVNANFVANNAAANSLAGWRAADVAKADKEDGLLKAHEM